MEQQLNQTLRKLRKAKGLTQELLAERVGVSAQAVSKWEASGYPDAQLLPQIAAALDVTIDELFGNKKEEISLANRILYHLRSLPYEDRINEAYELCLVLCQMNCGDENYAPVSKARRDDMGGAFCQITNDSGILQARLSRNLPYFLLMPEPKEGYGAFLQYEESYTSLFSLLAVPNALRAMFYLESQEQIMFFDADTLVHRLGITRENAEQIIDGMLKQQIVWQADYNNGSKSESIYQFNAGCNFVSLMTFAHILLNRPVHFSHHENSRKRPYLNQNPEASSN